MARSSKQSLRCFCPRPKRANPIDITNIGLIGQLSHHTALLDKPQHVRCTPVVGSSADLVWLVSSGLVLIWWGREWGVDRRFRPPVGFARPRHWVICRFLKFFFSKDTYSAEWRWASLCIDSSLHSALAVLDSGIVCLLRLKVWSVWDVFVLARSMHMHWPDKAWNEIINVVSGN